MGAEAELAGQHHRIARRIDQQHGRGIAVVVDLEGMALGHAVAADLFEADAVEPPPGLRQRFGEQNLDGVGHVDLPDELAIA